MADIEKIKEVLNEFVDSELLRMKGSKRYETFSGRLRGSVDLIENAVDFILHCKILKAKLSLINDTPLIRVILFSGKLHRTVSPSTWKTDLLSSFGFMNESRLFVDNSFPRFIPYLDSLINPERMVEIDQSIKEAGERVLSDEKQISKIKEKLSVKRKICREKQINHIKKLFSGLPPDSFNEDDIIKFWREVQVKSILDK